MTTCSPPPKRHPPTWNPRRTPRSEEHTSELQSQSNLVCRLLLEKKKTQSRVNLLPYSETQHRNTHRISHNTNLPPHLPSAAVSIHSASTRDLISFVVMMAIPTVY